MLRVRAALIVLASFASLIVIPGAHAARPPASYGYIPMSDGVTLKYQVLLPDPARWGPGPYPSVMDYSGYIPAETIYDGLKDRFRESGYAVIGLNMRGTHCSGGYFDYFEPRQALDGKEAIEWLTQEPTKPAWSNGRLAMVGKSYPGITPLFVAAQQPKGLVAIVPGHVFGDLYRDVPYPGGILNATFAGYWSGSRAVETMTSGYSWYARERMAGRNDQECLANQPAHAPNTAKNPLVQALYNQYDGPLFYERSPWWWADKIDVPTMLVQSWQDEQVGSRATHLIERFRPGLKWKFLSANGDHGEYYGDEMLPHIYRFLEFTLRGESVVDGKFWVTKNYERTLKDLNFSDSTADAYWAENPVIINFENGANGGRNSAFTKTFSSWPPQQQVAERYYLTPDRGLSPTPSEQGRVDYNYVPYAGSQERGGANLTGNIGLGDWKRRPLAGSFAAFTSQPLTTDKVMLGTASLDLFLSSTAPDTDLQATLSEVRPDGQEMFVQKGWLRASHRKEDPRFSTELRPFQTHLLEDVQPLIAEQPTSARIEIFPFAHAFRAGSKIRISVEAPNIMADLWGFASLPTPAVNSIHTSQVYPSSLALPVLSGASAPIGYPSCYTSSGGIQIRNQPCRPE